MKNFAISDITTGKLNAMVKTVMSQMGIDDASEAVRRINSREWVVSKATKYFTKDIECIRYVELPTTIGTTGPEWSKMLNTSKWLDNLNLLNSDKFWVTENRVYEIAIIPGKNFSDNEQNLINVCKYIDNRGWLYGSDVSPEVACLIRQYLSDSNMVNMGFSWLAVMHEPIEDSNGDLSFLLLHRNNGHDLLDAAYDFPASLGYSDGGFVCVVSQDTQN